MDFLGGSSRTQQGHDYLYVVVNQFSKMVVLVPCKKTITNEEAARLFLQHVWTHFGFLSLIVSDCDSHFLSNFCQSLWSMMDTKLQWSMAFHTQTDPTKVVNWMVVHMLRGYNTRHPKTWDKNLLYL